MRAAASLAAWAAAGVAVFGAPAVGAVVPATISTFAGGPGEGRGHDLEQLPVALAAAGSTLYVGDALYRVVRALDATTCTETVVAAGTGEPTALATDGSGNVYVAGLEPGRVQKVDGRGGVTDMGSFSSPQGLALDAAGNLYVAETGANRIRRVDRSGDATTVAGTGVAASSGDGGPATAAALDGPTALLAAGDGSLYVVDSGSGRVRRIDASGTIATVATGLRLSERIDLDLMAARSGPGFVTIAGGALAIDPDGSLDVAETFADRVVKVRSGGPITTVVAPPKGAAGDTLRAVAVAGGRVWIGYGGFVDVDRETGDRFWGGIGRVSSVTAQGGVEACAGGAPATGGDGGPATRAQLEPWSLAVDAAGALYVSDAQHGRVRKVGRTGTISSLPLRGLDAAQVAVGRGGTLYVADRSGRLVAVARSGRQRVVATGLGDVRALAADAAGNVYVGAGRRVRKVDPAGRVTTVRAGRLAEVDGLAVDAKGNLYVVDGIANVVGRIDRRGTVTRIAGNGSTGYAGDGGPATKASLFEPAGIAVDVAGNVYVADVGSHRVRVIDRKGTITTVAGSGPSGGLPPGFAGDGGPATQAYVDPVAVAVDAKGNLYIADRANRRVRRVALRAA